MIFLPHVLMNFPAQTELVPPVECIVTWTAFVGLRRLLLRPSHRLRGTDFSAYTATAVHALLGHDEQLVGEHRHRVH